MDVEFENVRAHRDGRTVLEIPTLRIHGDRTTAVLGPNGSGKTTLLRLVAGLDRPAHGSIRFGDGAGTDARFTGRNRPDLAYVFQERVFLRQSVRENLELGLRLRGLERAVRRSRVDEAARLLGIGHLLDRRADRLSGGEGRRVSLARALCLRAPLVLLDEPLEGLDERTYSRLLEELPQLLGEFHATTLLVTHSPHEALRLADDLVIVVEGRVHASGSKRHVAANPATREVADVLGFMVLAVNGRPVAVPPGALKHGPGPMEFWMVVEGIVDLVERREIVGRIGEVRAAVPVDDAVEAKPGQRVLVHAERACDLSPS